MLFEGKYLVTYQYQKDAACANMHTATETVKVKVWYNEYNETEPAEGKIASEILSKIREDYGRYKYEIGLVNFWEIEREIKEEK